MNWQRRFLWPFLCALQLLTRLPVHRFPVYDQYCTENTGNYSRLQQTSVLWYPIVGLLIGFLVAVSCAGLLYCGAKPTVVAACGIALVIYVTGALHLDGLADWMDAWVGGFGSKDRTLAIMKDPRSGPIAVAALVAVLLLKFSALEAILSSDLATSYQMYAWIILPFVLSRAIIVPLFSLTPYVRQNGMGKFIEDSQVRAQGNLTILLLIPCLLFIFQWHTLLIILITALIFYLYRALIMARIGGTTGDTAGALVELTETGLFVLGSILCQSV
ncbi:cobalamin synthase [Oleiphilus messinensis]|uniref:Adenosylcobinamide-GDP ribazoletransferase n=1 Tax=Oleiphilus messinensis TaxID=141451 RepID=A0A1Y0I983_9GAMM|nr:adenosylcobinamide-GDP ribazoletransferase [Oleiphilus messinensis]ARU56790.1 cobalamin synthase [Oleiphilus messinensis]